MEGAALVDIAEPDAPLRLGVASGRGQSSQDDGLIATQVHVPVDRAQLAPPPAQVRLDPDRKEYLGGVPAEQMAEIDIGAVHDLDGARFGRQLAERFDVVQFALHDV